MAYEHRVSVRYAETDQMGVAHHANFLLYMEDARTAYMRALGAPYGELEKTGVGLPVRQVDVRYRASAYYEDELVVRVEIASSRAASVTFVYELRRAENDDLIATASIELACVDLATRRPRVLPESLRQLLVGEP